MVDTIRGHGQPPAIVNMLIQRLPDESATFAMARGGWEHFGWGQTRHLLADVHDAIQLNTRVSRDWKRDPDIPYWPRPKPKKSKSEAKKPRVSVKDIFFGLKQK